MTLVVVGGGPAGLAAVRGYRSAGGRGRVVLVGQEGRVPYSRPSLSKALLRSDGGEPPPIEPEGWFRRHDVELIAERVVELDLDRRRARTDADRVLRFDACVLATGGRPTRPPLPGADDPGIHVLRTADDRDRLVEAAREGSRVAIVGTGFVGCEAAASLAMRGAQVTLVGQESVPQAARLGEEVGERIAGWLAGLGVELRGGVAVDHFAARADRRTLELADGSEIAADEVVLAVGVAPDSALAQAAGMVRTESGRIPAGADLRTDVDGVLVAGDVAAAHHPLAGRRIEVEHWGEALEHGRLAGRTAAGDPTARWHQAPGFWSTIGERTLKQVAWGDGHDAVDVVDHGGGAFTATYGRDGICVGVLTYERDADYARGRELVEHQARIG